ncbi:MAG: histidine phosphatase family protein [Pseudomonadota bacterium]
MRHLILFRHGKAELARPGEDDHDRALAPRGWDDAPLVAKALIAKGLAPDTAYISTARRCRETWAAITEIFMQAAPSETEDLYLAAPRTILEIADASDGDCMLIVGHNPGLQDLSVSLAPMGDQRAAAMRTRFPTSAASVFSRESDDAPWRFVDFIVAKDLRAPE